MPRKEERNYAYIDGQNLHLGTKENSWSVDYRKLRKYLSDKYNVVEAHYFLGFISDDFTELYNNLQKADLFFRSVNILRHSRGIRKGMLIPISCFQS